MSADSDYLEMLFASAVGAVLGDRKEMVEHYYAASKILQQSSSANSTTAFASTTTANDMANVLAQLFQQNNNIECQLSDIHTDYIRFGFPFDAIAFQAQHIVAHYQNQFLILFNMQEQTLDFIISRYTPSKPDKFTLEETKRAQVHPGIKYDKLENFKETELEKFRKSRLLKVSIPFKALDSVCLTDQGTIHLSYTEPPRFFARRASVTDPSACIWKKRGDFTKNNSASRVGSLRIQLNIGVAKLLLSVLLTLKTLVPSLSSLRLITVQAFLDKEPFKNLPVRPGDLNEEDAIIDWPAPEPLELYEMGSVDYAILNTIVQERQVGFWEA